MLLLGFSAKYHLAAKPVVWDSSRYSVGKDDSGKEASDKVGQGKPDYKKHRSIMLFQFAQILTGYLSRVRFECAQSSTVQPAN